MNLVSRQTRVCVFQLNLAITVSFRSTRVHIFSKTRLKEKGHRSSLTSDAKAWCLVTKLQSLPRMRDHLEKNEFHCPTPTQAKASPPAKEYRPVAPEESVIFPRSHSLKQETFFSGPMIWTMKPVTTALHTQSHCSIGASQHHLSPKMRGLVLPQKSRTKKFAVHDAAIRSIENLRRQWSCV